MKLLRRFWKHIKNNTIPGVHNAYRPLALRRAGILFFLAVVLVAEGFLTANLLARQAGVNFLAAVVQNEIILLTNSERAQNNFPQLKENALLDAAALAKAKDMATNGYFSHDGPGGKTPWQWIEESGYDYQYAGENLAVRFTDSKNAVDAWMASPTHRANIIKMQYTEIGVGIAEGIYQGQPATYVVQYFGAPATAAGVVESPTPVQNSAEKTLPAVVPTNGTVEAAQTTAQTVAKQAMRAVAEPVAASAWVLGTAASVLFVLLALTFFIHIQIQHKEMLTGGILVAGLALSFMILNKQMFTIGTLTTTEAASVVLTLPQ